VLGLLCSLPRHSAGRLLDLLATLTYRLDTRHRHIAAVNLKIAFPELSDNERERIARASFQHTGRNLLEISRMSKLSKDNVAALVDYDPVFGMNNYQAANARGKGILFLTGHFGAWELLPVAHALYGYPLSFVARPLDNPYLEDYLYRARTASGNTVLDKKNASRQILRALKSGGAVGILMDQNTGTLDGIFSDFFGVPAPTTTSMALMALRTDAPIVPGFLVPRPGYRYTIKFLPPMDPIRTGDTDHDIAANTRAFNGILEKIIREQPETWLWGHKRWKYQPPGNPQNLYELKPEELDRFLASRLK
jgi:Kdo2-lipid IVA lauroyltransferase/acyltransferase